MSEQKLIDSKRVMKESRVALSKEVCCKLDVHPGDIINFIECVDGEIVIRKAAI